MRRQASDKIMVKVIAGNNKYALRFLDLATYEPLTNLPDEKFISIFTYRAFLRLG